MPYIPAPLTEPSRAPKTPKLYPEVQFPALPNTPYARPPPKGELATVYPRVPILKEFALGVASPVIPIPHPPFGAIPVRCTIMPLFVDSTKTSLSVLPFPFTLIVDKGVTPLLTATLPLEFTVN